MQHNWQKRNSKTFESYGRYRKRMKTCCRSQSLLNCPSDQKISMETNDRKSKTCIARLGSLYPCDRYDPLETLIVEALKSTVICGDKLRLGDGAALLNLSDKLESCCHIMNELNSNELNCTTNLKSIYDRLPDSLQAKWRKKAKLHRERNKGSEPTLRELAEFIAEESQAENDPVYGRRNDIRNKPTIHPRQTKPVPAPRSRIPTLATSFQQWKTDEHMSEAKQESQSKSKETCPLCHDGAHGLAYCTVFLSKPSNWRRKYAKSESLCYLCLSNTHVKKDCTSKFSCNVKDCKSPSSHNKLLHYDEKKSDGNTQTINTAVNSATMENSRSFVKLKVVPVHMTGENGSSLSTYGLLDTAVASSLITEKLANKLQLQGVPKKVAISTVTHNNKECELSAVNNDTDKLIALSIFEF